MVKPLLPSLREKKRYIMFKVLSQRRVNEKKVFDSITWSTHRFMGDYTLAKAGMHIMQDKWDVKSQTGIIRVNHKYTDHVKASLALIQKVDGQDIIFRSLGVSGILNKTKRFKK